MGIEDRRAREFQRREQDILAAALGLAGSSDWQSVTIDHIAERAEIGKGTVYKHFGSKDEVCARLVMDHGRELLRKLRAVDPTLEYVPRFKTTLRTVFEHNTSRPEMGVLGNYCEVSEASLHLNDAFAREFRSVREQIAGHFHALVEEGIARGIIAKQPQAYMMAAGWSTMSGAVRLTQTNPLFQGLADDEGFLDYLVDFLFKGLMNAQVSPAHAGKAPAAKGIETRAAADGDRQSAAVARPRS